MGVISASAGTGQLDRRFEAIVLIGEIALDHLASGLIGALRRAGVCVAAIADADIDALVKHAGDDEQAVVCSTDPAAAWHAGLDAARVTLSPGHIEIALAHQQDALARACASLWALGIGAPDVLVLSPPGSTGEDLDQLLDTGFRRGDLRRGRRPPGRRGARGPAPPSCRPEPSRCGTGSGLGARP